MAIAAANKVDQIGIEDMYSALLEIGRDTDTNCSIAGQIAGTFLCTKGISKHLIHQLKALPDYEWIETTIGLLIKKENWS